MKKKRLAPKKASKPPPERGGETYLQYKVVELSTVDEGAIERTINLWVRQGWNLDGVQFAMRESSKRPAMAFVFFTRETVATEEETRPDSEVRDHLARLAGVGAAAAMPRVDPHTRLAQLAGVEPDPDGDPVDQ